MVVKCRDITHHCDEVTKTRNDKEYRCHPHNFVPHYPKYLSISNNRINLTTMTWTEEEINAFKARRSQGEGSLGKVDNFDMDALKA